LVAAVIVAMEMERRKGWDQTPLWQHDF
jgi:hypothetical protein